MATTLKLIAVGTSTGFVVPKEMLNHLEVKKGDMLHATATKDGYLLTPYDPIVEEQLKHARDVMKEHREALRALAK